MIANRHHVIINHNHEKCENGNLEKNIYELASHLKNISMFTCSLLVT